MHKLWEKLVSEGEYSGTFEQFKEEHSNPENQINLHKKLKSENHLSDENLDFKVFKTKFFEGQEEVAEIEEVEEVEEVEVEKPFRMKGVEVEEEETEIVDPREYKWEPLKGYDFGVVANVDDLDSSLVEPGGDIDLRNFDNVGETELITLLEEKYGGYLEFDEPVITYSDTKFYGESGVSLLGGMGVDIIQVTNKETGETKDFKLNTEYNGELSESMGREVYLEFLEFATNARYDAEGHTKDKAKRYLSDDYSIKGVRQEVTKEMTYAALKLVKEDESGVLTMDKAIDQVLESEWGQMHVAWKQGIYNQTQADIVSYKEDVREFLIEDQIDDSEYISFDPASIYRVEATQYPNLFLDETYKTLIELGMPEEVLDVAGAPKGSLPGDTSRDTRYLINNHRLENVKKWLNNSEKGQLIRATYNEYENEKGIAKTNEEFGIEAAASVTTDDINNFAEKHEISTKEAKKLLIEAKQNELHNEKSKGTALETLKFTQRGLSLDNAGWNSVLDLKDKALTETDPILREKYKAEFTQKIRELFRDGKLLPLRNEKGEFVNPTHQKQYKDALNRKGGGTLQALEDYIFTPSDELIGEFDNIQIELKTLAKILTKKGLDVTMGQASLPQQIGEEFFGGTVFNRAGGAESDFWRMKKWLETGDDKYSTNLTTIPGTAGGWDVMLGGDKNAIDPYIKRYNELVEKREILVLAQSLNVDPTSYSKSEWGPVRFADALVAAIPGAVDARYVGETESRQLGYEIYENAFGFRRTEEQENFINQFDNWEKAGGTVPGLLRMGVEMYLTYQLTGGAGNLAKGIGAFTEGAMKWAMRKGLSKELAKKLVKYSAAVGTEYIGLLGSNAISRGVFGDEGIENPLLFAAAAGAIRMKSAQMRESYQNAIIDYAGKPGNENFQRNMLWVSKQNVTANKKGIIPQTIRNMQFTTRTAVKTIGLGTEAIAGAGTIKAGEFFGGLPGVITGETDFTELWNQVTDSDSLFELAGALLFMKGARPDQYMSKLTDGFFAELDLIRGDNPQFNRLLKSLDMKRRSGNDSSYKDPKAFAEEVDAALEKKVKEIEEGEGTNFEKKQQIKNLKFNANRLKLKPALDEIGKYYENLGVTNPLETAALNIFSGSESALNWINIGEATMPEKDLQRITDMLTLVDAGATSNGTSAIIQLMSAGATFEAANKIYKRAEGIIEVGRQAFGGDYHGKNFVDYCNEAIRSSELKSKLENVEADFKANNIDKAYYEFQKEALEAEIESSSNKQLNLLKNEAEGRVLRETQDIITFQKAGGHVIEGSSAKIEAAVKEMGKQEWAETEYGLEGVDNRTHINGKPNPNHGKRVILIDTEATARDKKSATDIHEKWHHPFEKKFNSMNLKQKMDYVKEFEQELKDRGLHDKVLDEMLDRGTLVDGILETLGLTEKQWKLMPTIMKLSPRDLRKRRRELYKKAIEKGMKIDFDEYKEFINEFIQLDFGKSFNIIKGKEGVKSSKKQSEKDLKDTDFNIDDPKTFVDFVLSGKYKSKNIDKFLVEAAEVGGESTTLSKSIKENNIIISKENERINEDILNSEEYKKSLEKGKEEVPKEYKDKLVENNIARVKQLAGVAANNPNFFGEGVTYESWLSGYKKELTALSNTYKPSKNPIKKNEKGEVISRGDFGAYMNKNLPLRYGDVIKELTAGETKGPKVRFGESTTEGGKKFDLESADLSPEELMIAKEDAAKSKRRESQYSDKVSTKKVFTDTPKGEKLLDTYKGKVKEIVDKTIKTEIDKLLKKDSELSPEKARDKALEIFAEKINQSNFKGDEVASILAELIGIRKEVITKPSENVHRPKQDLTKEHKGKKKIGAEGVEWGEREHINRFLEKNAEILQAQLAETQLQPEYLKTRKDKTGKEIPLTPAQLKRKKVYGKQRVGSEGVGGTSLKLPPILIKKGSPLYESSKVRSGTKEGTTIKQFKENLRTDINAFKEAIGIKKVKPGEVLKVDRGIEQLQKGLLKFLNDKILVELAADYIESSPISQKAKLSIIESLKGGNSRFALSTKAKTAFDKIEIDPKIKKKILRDIEKVGKTISNAQLASILDKYKEHFTREELKTIKEALENLFRDVQSKEVRELLEKDQEKQRRDAIKEYAEANDIGDVKEAEKLFDEEVKNFEGIAKVLGIEYFKSYEKNILSEEHIGKLQEASSFLLENLEFNMLPISTQRIFKATLTAGTSLKTWKDGKLVEANPEFFGVKNGKIIDFIELITKQNELDFFGKKSLGKGNSKFTKEFIEKTKYAHGSAPGKKTEVAKINREIDYETNPKEWLEAQQEQYVHLELRKKVKDGEMTMKEALELTEKHTANLKEWYLNQLMKMSPEAFLALERGQVNASGGIARGLTPTKVVSLVMRKDIKKVDTREENVELHNEHVHERISESKVAFEIYSDKSLSLAEKSAHIHALVKRGAQWVIPKTLQGEKDTPKYDSKGKLISSKVKRLSESDIVNTLRILDSSKESVYISGKDAGKTIFETLQRDFGKKWLLNKIESIPEKSRTAEVVEMKQKLENEPNYNEIGKETIALVKEANMNSSKKMSPKAGREQLRIRDKALELARKNEKPVKKARVFDFDDTVARTKSNVLYEMPDGKKGKISAAEFAKKGELMEAEGAKWDFSEFNKVVDGKKGPLFEVMKKMKEAAGERDMFILTARSPEAAKAIQRFMKEMGIDIPLENIKGLGDSSPLAKSDWILKKASEGYNDFYFADDHTANVKAVQDVLDALGVKGKTQQAKFSASMKTKRDLKWKKHDFRSISKFEIEGKTYTIDLARHVDSKDYTLSFGLDRQDKKGFLKKDHFVTGTGNAAKVLSIVSNGVFDFVKKNKVDSISFTSFEGSRTRLYTTLTKLWANELGWKHEIEYDPEYKDMKGAASFVISKTKTSFSPRLQPTAKFSKGPVEKVLDVVDVKGKVQQTRMNSSKKLDQDFNKILEEKSGIEWYKDFSKSKGKVVGARKGKRKFFIPPSAEDFTGLIYATLGKGKKGEAQLEWYNENLIKPYNRATRDLATDKVQLMNDFKGLKKQLEMPKDLREITDSGYTKEQAARVYLWDKMGETVPNLTKKDLAELLDIVNSDGKLKAFADQILEATKGDGYSKPGKEWLAGTMTTDLIDVLNVNKRKKYLEEWQENIDVIYSEKNLNKLEAIYGAKYREALENSIQRMKTGKNRTSTGNKLSDRLLDYINGAQGTIMFLNMRSAVLQSISAANFINLGFNNPIKAGRAFANQKQFWKDFIEIMNSDYLVGRRQGLKLNISESEIADAAAGSTNKAKAVINYILEKGYAPTKFMDSFAIASGGATWYRNRIKNLMKKEGLSEVEAQKKAFEEFMEISEKSQQSSDPSKVSAQQASDMGRVFLQFVNTPMQYARIQKRAFQDLANKRGDWKSNISKILYYGVMQNVFFNAMQQGLFALGFGDDEINEKEEKKIVDTANGMFDSILRGVGFGGMTVSVLKNTIIDLYRRSGRQRPQYKDAWVKLLEFSPAIKSKFGKLKSAAYPFDTKEGRKEIKEKGFSLDNPAFESGAKVISAVTNVPLDRLFLKYNNLRAMMSEETETWKDVALFLGWPEWQLEEGGTVEEDEIKNLIDSTKKGEQVKMLLDLGYSKDEIRKFNKEQIRAEAIISAQQGKKYKPKKLTLEEQKIIDDKKKEKEDQRLKDEAAGILTYYKRIGKDGNYKYFQNKKDYDDWKRKNKYKSKTYKSTQYKTKKYKSKTYAY